MVDAVIPGPRRITNTRIAPGADAFSVLGDALSVAGQAGMRFEMQRRDVNEREREAAHDIAMAEQKRQDDALYIEKAQEWVQIEEAMRARAAALRQEAGPFARGHSDSVRKELDEQYRAFDESLAGNERVGEKFPLTVVQTAARIDAQEGAWQQQQEFKAQGDALEVANTLQLRAPDENSMGIGLQNLEQRYQVLIQRGIAYRVEAGMFRVVLPLIPNA